MKRYEEIFYRSLGQVEVMTKGLQRGHWESFEMEEFMHMYTLGDKLYSLQHEYLAAKFPSPSVSTVVMHLKNFKPLSLECDKCKGTFYSQVLKFNKVWTKMILGTSPDVIH